MTKTYIARFTCRKTKGTETREVLALCPYEAAISAWFHVASSDPSRWVIEVVEKRF